MNSNRTSTLPSSLPPQAAVDALQSRYALRIASRLTDRSEALAPDLTERLRFAREKALECARAARTVEAALPVGLAHGGAALLGAGGTTRWLKFAAVLPAFALAAGLFLIQRLQDNAQISTAAEVDAALLADDLPPRAYGDAGFAEFLKAPIE